MNTILHYYRFDISNENEAKEYNELKKSLKAMGLKLFDSIAPDHSKWYSETIKPLDGKEIELETEFLFSNQWNTAKTETSEQGIRVFDWAEAIFPNRKIKVGQWLEQTSEMDLIRRDTFKCNYCGKQYHKPEITFCSHCLGSEYLKETDLKLLFLTPIWNDKLDFGGITVPESLVTKYNEIQLVARSKRLEKRKADKLKDIQKDKVKSEIEYEGLKMIVNSGLDFENVIYYSHTDKFCFGWRNPISKDEAKKIENTLHLSGFTSKFHLEFKTC